MQTTIITAEWLINQNWQDMAIFDATWLLPTDSRDAYTEFQTAHISGAQFFDIEAISAPDTTLPHMIPNAERFQIAMQELGLKANQQVVVYDNSPFLSSARAWWMLRLFGHEAVCVLDGGLAAWREDVAGPVSGGNTPSAKGNFKSQSSIGADVITFEKLSMMVMSNTAPQIIDARATDRFYGRAPEPRAGLLSGHIPGAVNLPIGNILENGRLKKQEVLAEIFARAGVDIDKPAITSCGSGITAAGLTLALSMLGKNDVQLYDGSWAEWGASDAPIDN